jgi:GNAT superfamily N-acetyltransferase
MFIDASVPKECSDPVFEQLNRAFQKGKYKKLRGVPVYKIDDLDSANGFYYVAGKPVNPKRVADDIEVFGWINVVKKLHWHCYTVEQVFVFPQVRGEGWGKLLYDVVIDREGLILASGFEQSRLGRRMWKSMIKSDRYTIWAHDFRNPKRFADVTYDKDDDKIYSKLKIYSKGEMYWNNISEDVRLVAIKKIKTRARTK